MKNYFLINPMAGQGNGIKELCAEIENASKALQQDSEIYMTKCIGDATKKVEEIAGHHPGETVRVYACGGDGTLNEVVNGAVGFSHVEVGCVPIGTGNDFVRNFKDGGNFSDIRHQLCGSAEAIDLMKFSGVLNGIYQQKYCVNMFNMGFDCNVVELAGRLKKKPFIAGSAAYLLAVFGMFAQKKGIKLKLIEDGETIVDGEVLLCAIANGSYCGGGVYSSPQASLNDGYFDLNIINDITRREFLNLFPKYQKGTHLEVPGIERIIRVKKCQKLKMIPRQKNFFLCADGEIDLAEEIEFEIAPAAVKFIVPTEA